MKTQFLKYISRIWLILFFSVQNSFAQDMDLDKISIVLNVKMVGRTEIPAIILHNKALLSVTDVFDYLQIKNVSNLRSDSISGFFITQDRLYVIDDLHKCIHWQNKIIKLKDEDLIRTDNTLYLESKYFNTFGLFINFDFRSLSANLFTDLELPALRESRKSLLRKGSGFLNDVIKPDTIISRKFSMLRLGVADWSINSLKQFGDYSDTRFNVNLGGKFAGGDLNIGLNYQAGQPFRSRQQHYIWRYVNNENSLLRQVSVGNVYSEHIASFYSQLIGVQFTNAPTASRQNFGNYNLNGFTEPDWQVELYVNDILTNYIKSDHNGHYAFKVPLAYGNSLIKLKFYGPWGEESQKEEYITIPYNFIPNHQVQYSITSGVVEDEAKSKFSRMNIDYGLNNSLTVGGGIEYLSSLSAWGVPFFNASMRVGNNLVVSGEYAQGVSSKMVANYHLPSNIEFSVNYIQYVTGQKVVNKNQKQDIKAYILLPVKIRKFTAFSRISLERIELPGSQSLIGEMLFSTSFKNLSININSSARYNDLMSKYFGSDVSLGFRLPKRYVLKPRIEYEYTRAKIISARFEVQKTLMKQGYINLSYENNFDSKTRNINAGIIFDLSFARVGISGNHVNHKFSTTTIARGSFLYDAVTNNLMAGNKNEVGKGGLILIPFLDLNGNNRYDRNEPRVSGLGVRVTRGRVIKNIADTSIRIAELEPYLNYNIELSSTGFENLAWVLKDHIIGITIEPNILRALEIPVQIAGEVSGFAYFMEGSTKKPAARMLLNVYRSDSTFITRVISDPDGFYNYLGLPPGSYFLQPDKTQLQKLNLSALQPSLSFSILPKIDGDVKDGMDFIFK